MTSQTAMKCYYDRSSVSRSFNVGDKVMALLSIPGTALSTCFTGPYEVKLCLSATDCDVITLERRQKTHINMLKPYVTRKVPAAAPPIEMQPKETTAANLLVVCEPPYYGSEDELQTPHLSHQTAHLPNSEMLKTLPTQLCHLTSAQQNDITALIGRFPSLFGSVPTRTSVANVTSARLQSPTLVGRLGRARLNRLLPRLPP